MNKRYLVLSVGDEATASLLSHMILTRTGHDFVTLSLDELKRQVDMAVKNRNREILNRHPGFEAATEVGETETVKLDELQRETELLLKLLNDRQPGLFTWHQFVHERLKKIKLMLEPLELQK